MAKKKYTAEEIYAKNFKRLTGKTKEEYNRELIESRPISYSKLPASSTAFTKMEKVKNEENNPVKTPEYTFTAQKPTAKLNYNSFGVSPVANPVEYEREKAKYNAAVTESTKRAVAEVAEKERLGESLTGIPSLGTEKMVQTLKPLIKEQTYHSGQLAKEARAKEAAADYERQKELAKKEPVAGAIANITGSLFTPMSYVAEAGNVLAGERVFSQNSVLHSPAKTVHATQQGLTEDKSDAEAFLINTGLSIGQNLIRLPVAALGGGVGQAITLASMASSAAGQTTYEAIQRGATSEQALLLGTVAGATEALTEKIGLDNLFKLSKNSVKIFSKNAAKAIVGQMVSEGGEEMISEVTNIIADSIIMGDKSEMSQRYKSYIDGGMSEKDASLNTLFQSALQIGLAGLGGALSGGILGTGGTVVGSVNSNLGSEAQTAAKEIGVENLIAEGKTYGKDSTAYKLAEQAEKKLANNKKISAYAQGQLYNENRIENDFQLQKLKAEMEKEEAEETAPIEQETVSETTVQHETEEKKSAFTFEKAEPEKTVERAALPYEATAEERYRALGEAGKKGFDQLVNEVDEAEDIETFARKFEAAYNLGHSRLNETQIRQYVGEDFFDDYVQKHAFYNGDFDAKAELETAKNTVEFQGVPLAGTENGLVDNDFAKSLNTNVSDTWDKVAKNLNVKIELVNSIDNNVNVLGKYKDGVIQVNVNSDRAIYGVAAHEITHRIKEVAPEAYEAFKQEVVNILGEKYESTYNEVAGRYRTTGEKTTAEIEEEVIAEYTEKLIDSEEKFTELANRNQTLAQRLITFFKETIQKIKNALGIGTSAELDDFDRLVKTWETAYDKAVKAVKTVKEAETSVEKYAIKYTDKNVPYVEVESDILSKYQDSPVEEVQKDLKSALKDKYGEGKGVYISQRKIEINRTSRKEISRSEYSKRLYNTDQATLKDKFLSLFNADEVLKASRDYVNEAPKHSRKDDIVDFGRGNVYIKVGENLYNADVVVGYTSSNNMVFYDLVGLNQQKNKTSNSLLTAEKAEDGSYLVSDNSISDNVGRSATENAQNSEQKGKTALRKQLVDMNEDELRAEVTRLNEEKESLQKFIREGATAPTANDLMSFAVEMLDKYSSKYERAKLAGHLQNRLYELATGLDKNGNKLTNEDIERNMQRTARLVLNESTMSDNSQYKEYAALRKTLRSTPILVSSVDALDFGSKEDFAAFRKQNFGRLPKMKVVDGNEGNVDATYQMFSEEYPEFFPADVTAPSEQLEIMAGVFDALAPEERNIYEGSFGSAVNNFINDIYDYAVVYQHENDPQSAFDTMKEQRILEWRKQREYQNKKAQELYRDVKAAGKEEIAEAVKKVSENAKKAKEMRARNAMEKAIVGAVKWLNRNKKLVGATEALDKINTEVGEIIQPLVGDIPKGKNVVETLQDFLDKYLEENKDVYFVDAIQEYASKGISNKLTAVEKLEEILDAVEKLEEILDLVQMARHDVKTAHEQFLKDRDGNYFEIAKKVISEIQGANRMKDSDKLLAKMKELQFSPYVYFRYISGYADNSALVSLFEEMLEAEDNALLIARDGFEQFKDLVGMSKKDKDVRKKRKDFDTKIITVTLGGRTVRTTAAHIVALKLHTENEQNRQALSGGVTIPQIDTYLKGRKAEAWREGTKLVPVIEEINAAYNSLDEYAKSWHDTYKKFSDFWSKNLLNGASEKALGIKVASVDNYIHIRRDPNYLNSSFESILKNENGGVKIQNSGALKERTDFSNKPIYLESLTDVIQDQIRLVSEYSAKIEVLTKADKIFNAKLDDGTTFKSVLNDKFGQFGKTYLNNFLNDYNGKGRGKTDSFSKLAQGFRGNFAKYVLGANVTTRFVQMTSALNGAAEFGWDNFVKAASLPKKERLTLDDIRKYTARASARESGYINTELADKMSSIRLFDRAEKVSDFFMDGIAKNDRRAIQSILTQAQTYVENSQPELKRGSEEYFNEVVKAFNKAVNLTQQGNTVALRPEIFRTDNELLRLFAMFSSESVKNGNLMIDGVLNYAAKKSAYKASKTDANKAAMETARAECSNKITSVLATNAASAILVAVLKTLFKGQWDKYFEKDENGTLTPTGEGLLQTASDFAESMASSVVFGKYMYGIAEIITKGVSSGVEFVRDDDPDKTFASSEITSAIEQTLNEEIPEIGLIVDLGTAAAKLGIDATEFFAVMSDKNGTEALRSLEKFVIAFSGVLGVPAQNLKTAIFGTAETAARGIELFHDNAIGLQARYTLLKWKYSIYNTSYRQYFYDLLYEAYLIDDKSAYLDIRRDLLDHGISSKSIDNALKKRKEKTE